MDENINEIIIIIIGNSRILLYNNTIQNNTIQNNTIQ